MEDDVIGVVAFLNKIDVWMKLCDVESRRWKK
jgi:hypothetical protein